MDRHHNREICINFFLKSRGRRKESLICFQFLNWPRHLASYKKPRPAKPVPLPRVILHCEDARRSKNRRQEPMRLPARPMSAPSGKTENHKPIQSGIIFASESICVVPIHLASCISCACSPTMTSKTNPSKTPVETSIFRYGRRLCATNVNNATMPVKKSPSSEPTKTIFPPICR